MMNDRQVKIHGVQNCKHAQLYLLGWCFLQQTSPAGLRVNPSHKSRLSCPNSSKPSVILRPLTITTHILEITYSKRERVLALMFILLLLCKVLYNVCIVIVSPT